MKCENNGGSPIIYNDNDRNSFFLDIEGKPIRIIDSTRSGKNKLEETKLYQNTIIGNNIICPSPFRLFHNKYFTITYKLPIICTIGNTKVDINLLDNNINLGNICSIDLTQNEYDIIEIEITPKNSAIYGNEVETEFFCKNNNKLKVLKLKEPLNLFLQIVSDNSNNFALSNYKTTIIDQSIKTGEEYKTYFIRSKNGLNTCKEDDDCFEGHLCLGNLCLKCHSSCLRCSVDISESNANNYCTKCNSLSVSQQPDRGVCEMGYVEISQFENFEINILPDGIEKLWVSGYFLLIHFIRQQIMGVYFMLY